MRGSSYRKWYGLFVVRNIIMKKEKLIKLKLDNKKATILIEALEDYIEISSNDLHETENAQNHLPEHYDMFGRWREHIKVLEDISLLLQRENEEFKI